VRPAACLAGIILYLLLPRAVTAQNRGAAGSSGTLAVKEAERGKYMRYRQLVESDFPIDDSAHPESNIYTAGFFHYRYSFRCESTKGYVRAFVTSWKVESGFDRTKSSRKTSFHDIAKALPHEQGHLDINEIFSRRLANLDLALLPFGEGANSGKAADDLVRRLTLLADSVSKDAQAAQDAYDAQTRHGLDNDKQSKALAFIQAQLKSASAGGLASRTP
jgi:hypothetical protein